MFPTLDRLRRQFRGKAEAAAETFPAQCLFSAGPAAHGTLRSSPCRPLRRSNSSFPPLPPAMPGFSLSRYAPPEPYAQVSSQIAWGDPLLPPRHDRLKSRSIRKRRPAVSRAECRRLCPLSCFLPPALFRVPAVSCPTRRSSRADSVNLRPPECPLQLFANRPAFFGDPLV